MIRYKLNIYNIYKEHKGLHFNTWQAETHNAEHIIYIKITTGGKMRMVGGKLSEKIMACTQSKVNWASDVYKGSALTMISDWLITSDAMIQEYPHKNGSSIKYWLMLNILKKIELNFMST